LLLCLLLLLIGHYIEAAIRPLLIRAGLWGAPTAIVGGNEDNQNLACLLRDQSDIGLKPVGFIELARSQRLESAQLPLPIIGTMAEPTRIRSDIEVVIFDSSAELASATACSDGWMPHCQLLWVEHLQNVQSLRLHARKLGGSIGVEMRGRLGSRNGRLLKRIADLCLAVPILLLALPLIGALAVAIKIVDGGPAFYAQNRIGRGERKLRVFKLRTMYCDAEARLASHLERDPQARAEWQRRFKLKPGPEDSASRREFAAPNEP
jgi:Bacterial sugar transferase